MKCVHAQWRCVCRIRHGKIRPINKGPMNSQKQLIITCFVTCMLTKTFISSSLFAFTAALFLTGVLYILLKTVVETLGMRENVAQYKEFIARLKNYETAKTK